MDAALLADAIPARLAAAAAGRFAADRMPAFLTADKTTTAPKTATTG